MKLWIMKLGPLAPGILALLLGASAAARAEVWQPAPGHTQIAIWPGTPPDVQPLPGRETETLRTDRLIAGKPWMAATDVNRPTMTIYAPTGNNTGAAVVVFPGGGFQVLAMDLEGTEACRWLTSIGITCVLLKYRVPSEPFNWRCKCYDHGAFALSLPALEDAQRAIRLVRYHAAQWHVDPHGIGVLGFSAGGYLVAEVSTQIKNPAASSGVFSEQSKLLVLVELFVLPSLAPNVGSYLALVAMPTHRARIVSIRPELPSPQLLLHLRAPPQHFSCGQTLDQRHQLRHAVRRHRLHQKVNMILVRPDL